MKSKIPNKGRKKKTLPITQHKENENPTVKKRAVNGKGQKRKSEVEQLSVAPESAAGTRPRRSCNNVHKRRTHAQEFYDMVNHSSSPQRKASSEKSPDPLACSIKEESPPYQPEPQPELLPLPPASPPKQLHVVLQDVSTPEPGRSIFIDCDAFDVAPSPITPPLPKRIPIAQVEKDDAPSPQGMGLTPHWSNLSLHHATPLVTVKQEPAEIEDTTFFDANDSSLTDAALDLDVLIDEIFVKNSNCLGSQQCQPLEDVCVSRGEPNIFEVNGPEVKSDLPLQASHIAEIVPLIESNSQAIGEQDDSPHKSHPSASSPAPLDVPGVVTSEVSCGDKGGIGSTRNAPMEDQIESPVIIGNEVTVSGSEVGAFTDSAATEKPTKEVTCVTTLKVPEVVPDASCQDYLEELLDEEGFCEDLTLSDSQFLFIDAKCSLLKEISSEPSGASLTKRLQDISTIQTTSEKSAEQQVRPPPDLGFSVPPAPHMDWIQKILDSRQRLRMVTQDVSRLNAMVLRARRTLWPRSLQANPSVHQNPRPQPIIVQQNSPQSGFSDMHCDPDWNIS